MIRCFLLLVDYGNVVRSVKDSCTAIFLHSPEKISQSQVMFAFSQIQKSNKSLFHLLSRRCDRMADVFK